MERESQVTLHLADDTTQQVSEAWWKHFLDELLAPQLPLVPAELEPVPVVTAA